MSLTSAFRAAILDLDGVVVDTEALHLEATRIVFSKCDLNLPPGGAAAYVGRTDRDIFTEALESSGRSDLDLDALLLEKNRAYGDIADQMEPVDGVVSFIRSVKSANLQLALATSSVRVNQSRAFELLGLEKYFDTVVTADDVSRTKPDPEPYRLAVTRLGVPAASCFVVEDSFNGVKSARAAGCHVIGLTTSFDGAELQAAGAHAAFGDYTALANYLNIPYKT